MSIIQAYSSIIQAIQQHNTISISNTALARSDVMITRRMPGGETPVLRAVIASTQAV